MLDVHIRHACGGYLFYTGCGTCIISTMTREHKSIAKLPDTPGVYFFVGPRRQVLYVGKATSLRDRVRSYFSSDLLTARGAHMVRMVDEALRVEFRTTDSVLEALILEAHLIKELKPPYNTRDKDDKSWNYLVITTHEPWPRLLTIRGKDLSARLEEFRRHYPLQPTTYNPPVYGPFVHANQFKQALKLIRKIFPFYDSPYPVTELRARNDRKLRFNETIGVYPHGGTSVAEYARTIRHIRQFFEGRKKQVVRSLERDMHRYAKAQAFEKAGECKRQLFALQHINDISLLNRHADDRFTKSITGGAKRIEGYDVAHLQGDNMVAVMTVVLGGEVQKSEFRTFNIRTVHGANDTAALREILTRRLAHPEWEYPRLIVVDGGMAQQNLARTVLREHGVEIPVVAVTKDGHHRPKDIRGPVKWRTEYATDILLVNAEAHRFSLAKHRRKRGVAISKIKTQKSK